MASFGIRAGQCLGLLPRPCARRTRNTIVAAVSTSGTEPTSFSGSRNSQTVRILRYPDGHERRIIYPAVAASEVEVEVEDSSSIWTQTDEDESSAWNECGLAGAACVVADPDPLIEELALLHKRHNPVHIPSDVADLVKDSYQILTGSPWLLPRPLFVLTQQQVATGQATLYCLQARIAQEAVQDELAMVLKQPGLASSLSFCRMKDAVVAFDRAEDAARYATCLEADLPDEFEVMEVDSRQLFLITGDADAVVAHLPWAQFSPLPHQLAAALRNHGGDGAAAA